MIFGWKGFAPKKKLGCSPRVEHLPQLFEGAAPSLEPVELEIALKNIQGEGDPELTGEKFQAASRRSDLMAWNPLLDIIKIFQPNSL